MCCINRVNVGALSRSLTFKSSESEISKEIPVHDLEDASTAQPLLLKVFSQVDAVMAEEEVGVLPTLVLLHSMPQPTRLNTRCLTAGPQT